ncbi:branched-chain amino acid ABC transporter permease [Mesorhizobium sp.]|uniref:branched-chain amino acid ABC transporter permease n=2 Tax=Mesorhizobium sp. TaxID=1871066 RepID=UPI00257D1441|nr:branched-chain amino acid ABC transporter permease [Mesorhizobium sp.]
MGFGGGLDRHLGGDDGFHPVAAQRFHWSADAIPQGKGVTIDMAHKSRLRTMLAAFNGPQTVGSSPTYWIGFLAVVCLVFAYPFFGENYAVSNNGFLLVWTFLGLSVCILWGYTGIFSFGQTAFFGLAGYAYGIMSINVAPEYSMLAALAAIVVIMLLSAFIGYVIFYGGISSLYIAIFTLMLTLLAETLLNRTSGPTFTIGQASLGGSNGMVGIPPLQFGWGDWAVIFVDKPFFWLVATLLLFVFLGLRLLLNSNWGYLMVATREDPLRTQLFGYDVRWIQLVTYIIAAGLGGLGGVLFASWNNFISPASMGMTAATLPIIWVAAGGRSSILAVVIATFALQWINQQLAYSSGQYSLLFFAVLLLVTVMIFPKGIVSTVENWISRRQSAAPAPVDHEALQGGE